MRDAAIVRSRVAASQERIENLKVGCDRWVVHRRDSDKLAQHATQLDVIEKVLDLAVKAVRKTIPSDNDELPETYEACRHADRRMVWIERVWRFFAQRFDQRDHETSAAACLRAADEVLWSCWRPCFATEPYSKLPGVPGPAPLPYLDSVHAPEAFPATFVPADLAASYADAEFVRAHLPKLPVPTVRVPAAAEHEPWLLSLVAHETGHHLQFAAGLVEPFRTAVEGAVRGKHGDTKAVERWSGWSIELFADLASVAMLGPWALWPIAELELRQPASMAEPRGAYPPALVRLGLLAAAVDAVELSAADGWPASDPMTWDGLPDLPDMVFVDDVVKAGLAIGPPGFTLAEWIGLETADFEPGGEVAQWERHFGDGPAPSTGASLRAPRTVIAGVVAATAAARRAPRPERDVRLATIRDKAFSYICDLRAPELRAADQAIPVDADLGTLAAALVNAGDIELDGPGRSE